MKTLRKEMETFTNSRKGNRKNMKTLSGNPHSQKGNGNIEKWHSQKGNGNPHSQKGNGNIEKWHSQKGNGNPHSQKGNGNIEKWQH